MKEKYNATLVMLALAAVTSAISTSIYYGSLVHTVSVAQQKEMALVSSLVQDNLNMEASKQASMSSLVANIPSVQNAVQGTKKEDLKNLLVPGIKIQHDVYGMQSAELFSPPANVFYSFLNEKDNGVDVSSYREMVLAANQKNKSQQGIEVGRNGLSIRGITPIKDAKGTTLASFEVSTDFSPLLHTVKRISGFDTGVFVDKKIISNVATNLPKASPDQDVGSYQMVDATKWESIKPLVDSHMLATLNDVQQKVVTISNQDYGLVLMPLRDYKGDKIGAVVAVESFADYQYALKMGLIESIVFGVFQMLFLSGALLIIINGAFLNPISKINDYVKHILNDEKDIDASRLPTSAGKLGELSQNIQQVKAKLENLKE